MTTFQTPMLKSRKMRLTFLNESADPTGRPNSYVRDALLQELYLLLYLRRQKEDCLEKEASMLNLCAS